MSWFFLFPARSCRRFILECLYLAVAARGIHHPARIALLGLQRYAQGAGLGPGPELDFFTGKMPVLRRKDFCALSLGGIADRKSFPLVLLALRA